MTVAAADIAVGSDEHAVHFYERESDLSRTVGRYLVDAAQDGAVALLCAYRSELASEPGQAEALRQVCQLHSSVFEAPAGDDHAAPGRAITTDEVRGQFPAELDAPGKARHLVADAFGAWGRLAAR
jgi:hypothetical protein